MLFVRVPCGQRVEPSPPGGGAFRSVASSGAAERLAHGDGFQSDLTAFAVRLDPAHEERKSGLSGPDAPVGLAVQSVGRELVQWPVTCVLAAYEYPCLDVL